jgi:hypothetical protein
VETRDATILLAAIALSPALWTASGDWLDSPLTVWNKAGQALPTAPEVSRNEIPPICEKVGKSPVIPPEKAVADAGWRLFATSQDNHGVVVVGGAATMDGMCRPDYYQEFVFVNGKFVGTISPVLMYARSDGAAIKSTFPNRGRLRIDFARYTEKDPLCCPSRISEVTYKIRYQSGKAVLVPSHVQTRNT